METKKFAPVTTVIVIANIIMFVLCVFTDEATIFGKGGLIVERVVNDHEYLRILSSMFLHADFKHLFNNMLILFLLGQMLEHAVGSLPFAVTYMLSGIGGGLLSLQSKLMYHENDVISIGASGAIFGLDGLLLAFILYFPEIRRQDPSLLPRALLMVGLSLYAGFASIGIDNAAHIGGLAVGFGCGLIICPMKRRKEGL